jgi:hypothetical protein
VHCTVRLRNVSLGCGGQLPQMMISVHCRWGAGGVVRDRSRGGIVFVGMAIAALGYGNGGIAGPVEKRLYCRGGLDRRVSGMITSRRRNIRSKKTHLVLEEMVMLNTP